MINRKTEIQYNFSDRRRHMTTINTTESLVSNILLLISLFIFRNVITKPRIKSEKSESRVTGRRKIEINIER